MDEGREMREIIKVFPSVIKANNRNGLIIIVTKGSLFYPVRAICIFFMLSTSCIVSLATC